MADKEGSINIYARLRKIMPWEDPVLSATAMNDKKIVNRTAKRQQAYEFTQVFKPTDDNNKCFKHIGIPLINEVQRGYNAILMAYGQTGSGKTYSVLGKLNKDNKSVKAKGLLTLSLEYLLSQKNVSYLELSAIETFGHHIQKIRLFDLANDKNQIEEWDKKEPMKSSTKIKKAHKIALTLDNIEAVVDKLHRSSHFAPTGKNPESSRGHICYVTTVHLKYFEDDAESGTNINVTSEMNASHVDLIAHWIVVDLAGSEGESAINAEFQKTVEASEVMARRLEAWCINHGLSQLQVIFNELRGIKKKGISVGTGLKKTLSEFISTQSFIAVLFTISPSQDNSKSTEATLRFAESAALVKCHPVKTEKKINKDVLIEELNKFIKKQRCIIDDKESQIAQLERQILDTYLLDGKEIQAPITPITPQDNDDNHTPLEIDLSKLKCLQTLQESRNSDMDLGNEHENRTNLELPHSLKKQLDEFAVLINEEKAAQDIWTATKSQFISYEDEEDLEQSMKDQMSDVRRASRVSTDVQFVSNLLSLSDHSEIGFNEDIFRINPLAEEEDDDDVSNKPYKSYRVQKILNDYANGYQLLESSLTNLNQNELMYLCTRFAKYNNAFHQNETDKIIESHEEQIQFLTQELNRLQRYHDDRCGAHHASVSLQSDGFQLHMMMDDIDEKFEQNIAENKVIPMEQSQGGNASPSSTCIDPIAAYNNHIYENAPLVKKQHDAKIMILQEEDESVDDLDDNKAQNKKEQVSGHCCVIL